MTCSNPSPPKSPTRTIPPSRERELSADLYRVFAVVVVVAGHWLAASITYRNGRFGDDAVLAGLPPARWLTLFFQVIPILFLVAGYACAASLTRWGGGWRPWLRRRALGVFGPATLYVAVVTAGVAAAAVSHVDARQLAYGAGAVSLHLWFLPLYLILVALSPLLLAAQRRWGLAVPGALAAAVVVAAMIPAVAPANFVFGWAAVYQCGIAWFTGELRGRRAWWLAAAGVLALTGLLASGRYPLSMVGVPGQAVRNTSPPTPALLAFGLAQAGLLVGAAPAVTAWLRRSRIRGGLARLNTLAMALYLWHMVPVVLVAPVVYPSGLFPQPPLGSAFWWWTRLAWLAILAVVMAILLVPLGLLRPHLARWRGFPLPVEETRLTPVLLAGVALAVGALLVLAIRGFAPGGALPLATLGLYFAGVALTALHGRVLLR
ncbi:acyltransferase family protein [Amycolatopsis rhizosphaerae]|uniref:acyltransferase family protein n=1 Tax=Amycolatopsis rhizosphaerae TaxID=2053003 RepID=UPI001C9886C5|nr:acyltransferase family protein [Amycolatopsis rhizosphaerae]